MNKLTIRNAVLVTLTSIILLSASACQSNTANISNDNINDIISETTGNSETIADAGTIESASIPESDNAATDLHNNTDMHQHTYETVDEAGVCEPHSYVVTKKAATCEENGKNVYTCSKCGDSYTEEDPDSPALGHNYQYQTTTVNATEYSPGTKRFSCSRCGDYKDSQYGLPQQVMAYDGVQTVYGYWDTACEQEILKLLNEYRVSLGLRELKTSPSIVATAHTRAKEIAYSYRHNHSRPTNEKWRTAYDEDYTRCGENIASGQPDAQVVTTGWINSPDHNENMINPRYYHVGIGVFVRVDCVESGEVTIPDPNGLSHEDERYYVQSFSS